jgi:hypothetical protein
MFRKWFECVYYARCQSVDFFQSRFSLLHDPYATFLACVSVCVEKLQNESATALRVMRGIDAHPFKSIMRCANRV